jgi:tetrapyrrole methylase family protein/MazG family protein
MKEHNGKIFVGGRPHDIKELLEVVEILRSENGCEWDRAQDFNSMKECLKNESQEVLDAITKMEVNLAKREVEPVLDNKAN